MTDQPVSSPDPDPRVGRLVAIARSLQSTVRFMVIGAFTVGMSFWLMLVPAPSLDRLIRIPSLVLLLVVLVPTAILALLYLAIKQLISLPATLSGSVGAGAGHLKSLGESVSTTQDPPRTKTIAIGRQILGLWRAGNDTRDVLLGTVALVRLANPVTLIAVLVSLGIVAIQFAVVTSMVAIQIFF